MDQEVIIPTEGETSSYVEVFTAILPFILLAIVAIIVIAIVVLIKMIKAYLKNSRISEEKLKMEQVEIQNIKERLDRIEKNSLDLNNR